MYICYNIVAHGLYYDMPKLLYVGGFSTYILTPDIEIGISFYDYATSYRYILLSD